MSVFDEPQEDRVTEGGEIIEDNEASKACTTGSGYKL